MEPVVSNHKKKLDPVQFRVPTDEKVDLKAWPTLVEPVYGSKKEYRRLLQAQVDELSALQRRSIWTAPCNEPEGSLQRTALRRRLTPGSR
jgi:hypothetical protein